MTAGAAPQLGVKAAGVTSGPDCDVLHVAWQLANLASEPVAILEGWLPHGRFFSERAPFEPVFKLPAGACEIIHRSVRYAAEPGEVVENAFLILRVHFGGRLWRILARMRVECEATGGIGLVVQTVTTHPVGFIAEQQETQRRPSVDGTEEGKCH